METEAKAPRGLFIVLGLVMILVAGSLAGVFIFRLQPAYNPPGSCPSGVACVSMPSNAAVNNFDPVNITVYMGINNTVQWTNKDTVQHTVVVCDAGGPQICAVSSAYASSAVLSTGNTYTVTFGATGVYHYYCSIHSATMRATVVVMQAPSS
jgi:plastocyanin